MLSNISPGLILLTLAWILVTAIVITVSIMVIRGRRQQTSQIRTKHATKLTDGAHTVLAANHLPGGGKEAQFLRHLQAVVADHLMVWRQLPASAPASSKASALGDARSNSGKALDDMPTSLYAVHQGALDPALFLLCYTSPAKLKSQEAEMDALSEQAKQAQVPLLMIDESSDLSEDELRTLLAQHVSARWLSDNETEPLASAGQDTASQSDAITALARQKTPEGSGLDKDSGHTQSVLRDREALPAHSQSLSQPLNSHSIDTDSTQPVARTMSAKTCPKCHSQMVRKRAKNGKHAGKRFWVCRTYPACRHVVRIKEG